MADEVLNAPPHPCDLFHYENICCDKKTTFAVQWKNIDATGIILSFAGGSLKLTREDWSSLTFDGHLKATFHIVSEKRDVFAKLTSKGWTEHPGTSRAIEKGALTVAFSDIPKHTQWIPTFLKKLGLQLECRLPKVAKNMTAKNQALSCIPQTRLVIDPQSGTETRKFGFPLQYIPPDSQYIFRLLREVGINEKPEISEPVNISGKFKPEEKERLVWLSREDDCIKAMRAIHGLEGPYLSHNLQVKSMAPDQHTITLRSKK